MNFNSALAFCVKAVATSMNGAPSGFTFLKEAQAAVHAK